LRQQKFVKVPDANFLYRTKSKIIMRKINFRKILPALLLLLATFQSVTVAYGQVWSIIQPEYNYWKVSAVSSDGGIILAAHGDENNGNGLLKRSIDGGSNWTNVGPYPGTTSNWQSLAMSANGTYMLAAEYGIIWLSTNGGINWTGKYPAGSSNDEWRVAMSDNGQIALAAINGRLLYKSTDYGATWSEITNTPAGSNNKEWNVVAVSGDGNTFVAGIWNTKNVFVSHDAGSSWSTSPNTASNALWNSADLSYDGQTAYIVDNNSKLFFKSTNGLATWATMSAGNNSEPVGISCSADGQTLALITESNDQKIYYSTDGGSNWNNHPIPPVGGNYRGAAVSVSQDGTTIVGLTTDFVSEEMVFDDEDNYLYTIPGYPYGRIYKGVLPLQAPTVQAKNLVFSSTIYNQTSLTWTNGTGSSRAVFVAATSSGTSAPVDATTYTANSVFGSGTQIGTSGWYCVYNGSQNSVSISGLTAETSYRVMVVEYYGTAGGEMYLTSTATNNPANVTTIAGPIPVAIPIEISGGNGANLIATALNQWTGDWQPPQAIYDRGTYLDNPDHWSQDSPDEGSTWGNSESTDGYGILVVDMQQIRNINHFRVFQMFSDGKTTGIEIFMNTSNTGSTAPLSSDAGWVSVTSGVIAVGPGENNGDHISSPTAIPVTGFSSRYIKVHAYANGEGYIELKGIKAFNYDGSTYSINYMRGGPLTVWTGTSSTDWNTAGNWNTNAVPLSGDNVSIPDVTNDPVIASGNAADCKSLTVENNAILTVQSGGSLITAGTVSGNVTIQREVTGSSTLTANKYHLVSVPLATSNNSLSSLFSGSYLYEYLPASNTWLGIGTSSTTALNETMGYMTYYPGATTTYSFTGVPNTGTFLPTVTYPGNAVEVGNYALVPNPYPSNIDWNASTGWTKTFIGTSTWIYNNGNYGVWNGSSGTNGASRYIAVGQAFFVQTIAANPSLVMDNSVRTHSAATFLKNTETVAEQLRVSAVANGMADELLVGFGETNSNDYNPNEDAAKFYGSEDAPQIYTMAGENKVTINALGNLSNGAIVPFNFETKFTGVINLTFANIESFDQSTNIYLKDELTNQTINLRNQPVYTFSHNPENAANRFKLFFSGTIGIEETSVDANKMWIAGNTVYINAPDLNGQQALVEVFNVSGQKLLNNTLALNEITTFELNFEGFVIVKLTSGQKVLTTKGILMK
jgi:photosystem II stability/assembly factor-like uncharacterized protein